VLRTICAREEVGLLEYDILGEVRAWRDGDQLDLGSAKQRAVLAVLLLEANQPVPAQRILTAVWGESPPAGGANVVQKYVSALRRALEPERSPRTRSGLLALQAGGYRLAVEPGALDVDAVAELVLRAEAAVDAGYPEQGVQLLGAALDRWQGEPLAGLEGPVFDAARERLAEQRAAAAERYAEILLDLGQPAQALPELATLVRRFPFRERGQALYLDALRRTGRQAEALTAYAALRQRLVDELGVEPGTELRRMHERILREPTAPASPAAPERPQPESTPPERPPQQGPQQEHPESGWTAPGRTGPTWSEPTWSEPAWAGPTRTDPTRTDPTRTKPRWTEGAGVGVARAEPRRAGMAEPAAGAPARSVPAKGEHDERWSSWWARLGVTLLPLATLGTTTWLVFGFQAGWFRSKRTGYTAAAYLALLAGWLILITDDEGGTADVRNTLGVIALVATWIGGTAHVALTQFRPARSPVTSP
jgi:DNA-binding SARP family transcriptional activator